MELEAAKMIGAGLAAIALAGAGAVSYTCLLYTSPSPRD